MCVCVCFSHAHANATANAVRALQWHNICMQQMRPLQLLQIVLSYGELKSFLESTMEQARRVAIGALGAAIDWC